jgi:hypothetical protein
LIFLFVAAIAGERFDLSESKLLERSTQWEFLQHTSASNEIPSSRYAAVAATQDMPRCRFGKGRDEEE